MNYRILNISEWPRLKEIMEERFIPHPDTASVAIAEDDSGKIAGVLFLQLALHMEPLVLSSPKVSFERLHDTLASAVFNANGLVYYAFSDKEIIDKMAAHVGMEQRECKVWTGTI